MNSSLLSLIFLQAYALGSNIPTTLPFVLTPTTSAKTGVTIHKRTGNFLDIEVPVNLAWVGCSRLAPAHETSYLNVDVVDDDIRYSFIPRRAVHDVPMCLEEAKILNDMMKGAKTVRIVGESHITVEPRSKPYPNDLTPSWITDVPKEVAVFFVRLQVGKKCRAYFSIHCDLPKNYWAGTTPVN